MMKKNKFNIGDKVQPNGKKTWYYDGNPVIIESFCYGRATYIYTCHSTGKAKGLISQWKEEDLEKI